MTDPDPTLLPTDTVRVTSPYEAVPSKPGPRWWERLRAFLGLGLFVAVMGMLVAASVAVVLIVLAVVFVTAFH